MAKAALLIGVSNYTGGFQRLAAAYNDVVAVRRVLCDPQISGFNDSEVRTVTDPDPQQMRMEIERLFANRRKDDLLLFYFSGHGIVNDRGTFHFTCTTTEESYLAATAIPASFVLEQMESSRSKQQIIILDSCFSGAFAKNMTVKGEAINLADQLGGGGQGRAVLTSSSATEYSLAQKESTLSIYTRYLVEGIETGAADVSGDGVITIDELHDYTSGKVREAAPAMKPKIYAAEQGYRIILAKAPIGDPKLEYRKEVEKLAKQRQGNLSRFVLDGLEEKRRAWNLTAEDAEAIRLEVVKPYLEFQKKLQRYEQALIGALCEEPELSAATQQDLKYLQDALGLKDENIVQIKSKTIQQFQPILASKISSNRSKPPETVVPFNIQPPVVASLEASPLSRISNPLFWLVGGAVFIPLLLSFLSNTNQTPPVATPSPIPAVETPPQVSAEMLFKQGIEKENKGDYQGAIDTYTKAIQLNPSLVEAYFRRGLVYQKTDKVSAAITDFNQAIAFKGDYAEAYNSRGLALYNLGEKTKAIDDFSLAIQHKPEFAEAYYNRGTVRSASDLESEAIDDFSQAIQYKPTYFEAYSGRGYAYFSSGRFQESIADFDRAIQYNPSYAEAYNYRGLVRSNSGNPQAALSDFDEAIKIKPNYAEAYNNRGLAHSMTGNFQVAIADYNQAIMYKPDFSTAFYNRANAWFNLKNFKEAISDFDKAIVIDRNWGSNNLSYFGLASAYFSRGTLRSNMSDKRGAIADYTKAIEVTPNYADPYYYRGWVYKELGEVQKAREDFQTAKRLYTQQENVEGARNATEQIESLPQTF